MCQKDEEWTIHFLNKSLLIRAKWALSASIPPISDAGILIKNGIIAEVGTFRELKKYNTYPTKDLGECILLPALVNPHLHLELSALKGKLPQGEGFVAWVREMLALRPQLKERDMQFSAEKEAEKLKAQGVFALGDISNTLITKEIFEKKGFMGWLFKEILSPELPSEFLPEFVLPSAHSPYTTPANVIKKIKAICNRKKGIFTIHCAESKEEVEFLKYGTGELARLLEERGKLKELTSPGRHPVEYLYELGVLDEKTLLVHCVYIGEREIELIKRAGAWVCLCPRSNVYIGVGRAPAEKLFKAGVKLCLGTDSLASNYDLSPLKELAYFLETNSWCSPLKALPFITLNAAQGLRLKNLGDIAKGFRACFVRLSPDNSFYFLFDKELK